MYKPWGRFFSNFVCFSESPNFTSFCQRSFRMPPNTHCMPFVANILLHFWALLCENGLFFFLLKKKINALDISNAFTKMKKEMLFVSALMWKNLSSTMEGISKFCPKIMKYFLIHNCWDMIQYARIPYSCHYNVLHSFNLLYCIVI